MNIVCLVSRQAMPNVIPVLMYNPSKVYLLMTQEERECGIHLKELFESKNMEVITKENIKAYQIDSVKNALSEIIANDKPDSLFINITGGTKPMSIAAYDFARVNEIPVFYCNTENLELLHLFPKTKTEPFTVKLTIKDYLLSYGYKIIEQKEISEIEKYYSLFKFIETYKLMKSFLEFNEEIKKRLAQSSSKFSVTSFDKNFLFQKNFGSFRIEFGNKHRENFSVNESEYKSGDWLEYYVYYKLNELQGIELMSGVKIQSDRQVSSEIDTIVLKDFKLYLISCKSGKKDNQFDLFQLETIRNISSGTFGKGLFVSVNESSESFLKRAAELQIKVTNISKGDIIEL
ncbi:MAG: DUF1887 family CARF protein [Ignavibacterium sp.]|jgi:hypothetical protein|nr:DUF1887 family CARF protein [Ignavibacterium sp.]